MPNKYYGKLDNGTNPQAVMYPDEKHPVPKSYFDMSFLITQTQTLGGIYPFCLIRTVPSDQFELGVDVLVTVTNPFVRRMLSTLNITTHFYYDRISHLWEGGKNHFTKGRTGNIIITFPFVDVSNHVTKYHLAYDACDSGVVTLTNWDATVLFDNQMSLASYFGVPSQVYTKSVDSSGNSVKDPETSLVSGQFSHYHVFTYGGFASGYGASDTIKYPSVGNNPGYLYVNALPFAMYQKLYAEVYAPKNLLVNNKNWYPDNPDDFILPYSSGGTLVHTMSRSKSQTSNKFLYSTVPLGSITQNSTYSNTDYDDPILLSLRYRQWQGDYFTASVPWIVRGDMYQIDFSDLGLLPVKPLDDNNNLYSIVGHDSNGAVLFTGDASPTHGISFTSDGTTPYPTSSSSNGRVHLYADASGSTYGLNANQIYELIALSRWQERNTRTDGDYNSLVKSHFNFDPNSEDWHSVYIGGSFTRMQFSEVLQTNQDVSSTTPLGSQVSRGIANQSGYIGKFTAPDYGYIMGLCSIIPNTFYTQGLSRSMFWNTTNEDEYYPEFNSMAPQAILNKEIFFDLDQNNVNVNDDVFAYTERYADYKYMPNRVAGSFTAPPSVSLEWSAYSYARYFSSTPSFNARFVTCYGFRRDMWSTPLLPEFAVQIAVKCDAIRPIPYDSIPGGNINV